MDIDIWSLNIRLLISNDINSYTGYPQSLTIPSGTWEALKRPYSRTPVTPQSPAGRVRERSLGKSRPHYPIHVSSLSGFIKLCSPSLTLTKLWRLNMRKPVNSRHLKQHLVVPREILPKTPKKSCGAGQQTAWRVTPSLMVHLVGKSTNWKPTNFSINHFWEDHQLFGKLWGGGLWRWLITVSAGSTTNKNHG